MKRLIIFIVSFLAALLAFAQKGEPDVMPKQPKKDIVCIDDSLAADSVVATGEVYDPEENAIPDLDGEIRNLSGSNWKEIRFGKFKVKKTFELSNEQTLYLISPNSDQKKLFLVEWDEIHKEYYPIAMVQDAIQTPIGVVFTATQPSRLFCVLTGQGTATYLRGLGDGRSYAYRSVFTEYGIKSYMKGNKFADGSSKDGWVDCFSGEVGNYPDYTVEIEINLWRQD